MEGRRNIKFTGSRPKVPPDAASGLVAYGNGRRSRGRLREDHVARKLFPSSSIFIAFRNEDDTKEKLEEAALILAGQFCPTKLKNEIPLFNNYYYPSYYLSFFEGGHNESHVINLIRRRVLRTFP